MPVYCYKCKDCIEEFEARHSMSFEDQACLFCDSKNIFKLPSMSKRKVEQSTKRRAGMVVDEYIENAKKEIKQQKIDLRTEEV